MDGSIAPDGAALDTWTVAGRTFSSRLVVGTGGFPQPGYPVEAEMRHQAGTVLVSIQFDGAGRVADAEVVQSSGVSLLDSNTRSFIRSHWHDPSFAGKTVSVPITYHLAGI